MFPEEDVVHLPKYICFKGDNSLYLQVISIEGYPYLQFSATDSSRREAVFMVTEEFGLHYFTSFASGKVWRQSLNWIWADAEEVAGADTYFKVVKLAENVVALKNMGNENFCKRLTAEGKESCLNAGSSTIDEYSRLVVAEPVLNRRMYNIKYDLAAAIIINDHPQTLGVAYAYNSTEQRADFTVSLGYTGTSSRTWKDSFSVQGGIAVALTGGIPEVTSVGITLSGSVTLTIETGKTTTVAVETKTQYIVKDLLPTKACKVTLMGTYAQCNVPFTYTQTDRHYNGEIITTSDLQGVFAGTSYSAFYYKAENVEPSEIENVFPGGKP